MNDEERILRERAARLSRTLDLDAAEPESLIGFQAGGMALAAPLPEIDGVRTINAPTPLPGEPRWLAGVVSLDGAVVPVVAPDALLGLREPHPLPGGLRAVVLGVGGGSQVVLAIDRLEGPIPAPPALAPVPTGAGPLVASLARGFAGDHLVIDVPALLAALSGHPRLPVEEVKEQR